MADPTLESLDAAADDPNKVAYIDTATKQLVFKNRTDDNALLSKRQAGGLRQATPEDIATRRSFLQNTTTAEQATSAAKLAANVSTFGLAGFDSAEDKQKIKDFRDASPTLSTLTEVASAAAPALLAPELAPGVMAELGLSRGAAGVARMIGEEVFQAGTIEREHAMEEERGIELGNVLMGVPLALGLSAAGRLARGASRRIAGTAEGALEAAESEGNAVAQGLTKSQARRSVGAAGAGPDVRPPLTDAEVRAYAANRPQVHAEVERLGGDAIEDVAGGMAPAFDEVHNIGLKRADVVGRMKDADRELMADFADTHLEAMDDLANKFDAAGQKSAARQVRDHVNEIREASLGQQLRGSLALSTEEEVADLAVAADRGKRTMDRLRTKYGLLGRKDIQAEGLVGDIDDVVNPLRAGLEDEATWGKLWAEKQTTENKLWSGDEGLIRSGSIWQHEFLEKLPGAAGRMRRGLHEVPVFKTRGDIVEHAIKMKPRDFELSMNAWEKWIDNAEQMSLLKTDLGVQSVGTTPVLRLQQGLNDMRTTIDELKAIREGEVRGANAIKKADAKASSQSVGELAFDTVASIPFGPGGAVKAADAAAERLTGKSLRDRLFQPKIEAPVRELSREEAGGAVRARQETRGKATPRGTPRGPSGEETAPTGNLAEQLGALGRGASTVARGIARPSSSITDSLAEISDHSRAIQERAALGLVSKDSRAQKLPPLAARFKEGAPDLGTAFQNKVDDLRRADADPQAFVDGMADTFGPIAHGGHEDLYTRTVARVQIGTQYLLANVPPSVGISMVRPDGIQPDSLAIMKFAAMYNAVFSPGDVVYDVGTGDATPTQIKALREVHPDIYGSLRSEVLKQVAQAGQNVPFETLRTLDNLFNLPGVAGPSFSPSMTKTMAAAYQSKSAPQKSLGGESVVAPDQATSKLAGLSGLA